MAAHLDPVAWRKKKRIIITVSVVAALLLIGGVTAWLLLRDRFIPAKRYAQAERALAAGRTEEAIDGFASLETFRDANDRAAELAFSLQKDGTYETVLKTAKVGDLIQFGRYEQDNDPKNGPEPITWFVLAERDGRLLLWSVYVLDHGQYGNEKRDTTWADCSLRTWLNDSFYNAAFTAEEKLLIPKARTQNSGNSASLTTGGIETEDNVLILAFDELLEYGVGNAHIETIAAYPTDYAVAQGVEQHEWYGTCKWWMRTPGLDQTNAAYCDMVGQPFYTCAVNKEGLGVRPMIWVLVGSKDR